MTQDNQLAIVCRQCSDNRLDFNAAFFSLALLLWTEATAFNRQFILVTLNPIHERLLASGVSTQMIYCRIMRNLVDPRGKLKLSSIARQRAIDLYENLLGQIQRRVIISNHPVDISRDWALIASDQFFKTALDPGNRGGDQVTVGCRTEILQQNRG